MRTIMHMLLGVLLWVVFAYYWHLVMQQPITDETRRALVIVGALVAAISLFDALWIAHNLRIARNGRRRTRPDAGPVPAFDFLGRLFVAQNDEQLRRARYIEVHVIEMEDDDSARGHKLFKITDEVPRS